MIRSRFWITAFLMGTLIACSWLFVPAMAQDDPEWLADKARLEELFESEQMTNEDICTQFWSILWPQAKKGNLEARATLFRFSYPSWPGVPQIFMPGRSGDEVSSRRDALILGIHSIGVQYDEESQQEVYRKQSDDLFNIFLNGWPKGDSFLTCLKNEPRKYCARYAASSGAVIETKLVPTFEEYATEIDALVSSGMKPTCINFYNGPWSDFNKQGDKK